MGNIISCCSGTNLQEQHVNNHHNIHEGNDNYYHTHKHRRGHELQEKDDGKIYTCSGCKVKGIGSGSHYFCKNEKCTFNLHKDCQAPRTLRNHKFYGDLLFVFYPSPIEASVEPCATCTTMRRKCVHRGRYCNACGMDIDGYFYRADGYDLHPCCINLPHKIRCAESGATMELKPRSIYRCDACGKKKVLVDGQPTDQVWCYVSQDKPCNLHVSCMMETLSLALEAISVDIDRDIAKGGDRTCRKKIAIKRNNKNGLEIRIKAPNAKKKLEEKFRTVAKYAQIVLGALISALIGDPTAIIGTVIINLLVAFIT